jgi:hypothetical protein
MTRGVCPYDRRWHYCQFYDPHIDTWICACGFRSPLTGAYLREAAARLRRLWVAAGGRYP